MEEYLLKIADQAAGNLKTRLGLSRSPTHVRLSTLSPLSNWGYPPGSEGAVLKIDTLGLVLGIEDEEDVPRDLVPWHNISYLTDGTRFAVERSASATAGAAAG